MKTITECYEEIEPEAKGHAITRESLAHPWVYVDTGKPVYNDEGIATRPCKVCNKKVTDEGHDPCIRNLPGVKFACCGHGNPKRAYIYWENGLIIRGFRIDQKREEGPQW